MRLDRNRLHISGVAVALFVISVAIGAVVSAALGNQVTGSQVPLVFGLLVGMYLLFSIKIADQWEKVAVLRLGRYIGLRGPGICHVIPIVDTLSRFVDQASVLLELRPSRHSPATLCL